MAYPFCRPQDVDSAAQGAEGVRLCVIGHPIAHSKSPQMQQAALASCGMAGSYLRVESPLEEGGFESVLSLLREKGFTGCNVTVPFKTRAFAAAVQTDALSSLCGASNTLVNRGGGWHAYNTDGPGFRRAVEELTGTPLAEQRVLLLGACGGAGSALAYQCALDGCPALTLVNRPKPALDTLAERVRQQTTGVITPLSLNSPELRDAVAEADLVVNATSLGLKEGDALPLPPEWLRPGQTVYDIVTHDTPFRRAAAAVGCRTDNGLGMLLWQGAYAFEHWFGILPPTAPMKEALQQA